MLATGCSFLSVQRVDKNARVEDETACSQSYTSPAIDGVVAALSGVVAVNLYSAAGNRDGGEAGLRTGAFATAGIGAAFLASAAYGIIYVNRCRGALNRQGLRGPPAVKHWDEHRPGSLGGPCRSDGSCDGELICDQPMHTCVPIEDTDEDM